MKAFILAAGKGSRISKEIGEIPKSTLKTKNGEPIIRHTVKMLLSMNIEPVVCVGYQKGKIAQALEGLPVTFIYNPFFSVTNNMASLWFAQEYMQTQDDLMILSADVIVEKQLLERVYASQGDILLAVEIADIGRGDYYFTLDSKRNICAFGPDIPEKKRDCANIGIAKVSGHAVPLFKRRLNELVDAEKYQVYFENILLSFIETGELAVEVVDVSGLDWHEIDYYIDYEKALGR